MPELHLNRPDPAKVRAAIAAARADDKIRGSVPVAKVLYLDDAGNPVGEWSSTQLPENPWYGITTASLIEPPLPMPQLVFLAETLPIHQAALDQKVADTTGNGWEWHATDEDEADETVKDEMEDWFQSLSPDEIDMREAITSLWSDEETVGWGLWECARDPNGILQRVYNVPAHTVKAHRNGFALCQIRDSRKVWFRRWGAVDVAGKRVDVDSKTGSVKNVNIPANDLFVVKRPSRRSTWYGIPGYISAIGWITLALAARDDNLWYFTNRREPRWAIILHNLGEDVNLEEDLRRALTVDLKQPHRTLIIPVNKEDAKIEFQQLTGKAGANEMSFVTLGERADKQVMIAHRVPAERLANSQVGALGGNVAYEANRVYKEGVINPAQEVLNARLNRFIQIEWALAQGQEFKPGEKPMWSLRMKDLDVRSEREDLDQAVIGFHADITTLREARHLAGYGPLMTPKKAEPEIDPATGLPKMDPLTGLPVKPEEPYLKDGEGKVIEEESEYNDKLFTELPGVNAGSAGPVGGQAQGVGRLTGPVEKRRLESMEYELAELIRQSRETHTRLAEIADEQ